MATAAVILAAGKGSRMKSDRPKVLHQVGQAPLLYHALRSADALSPERKILVVGPDGEEGAGGEIDKELKKFPDKLKYDPGVDIVRQAERLGTAHAVDQARGELEDFDGDVFVLYADTPFIKGETLKKMAKLRADGADMVVLGFEPEDPGRYGRLVADGDRLERIVEFGDASDEERAIRLCNSGVLAADRALMFELIGEVGDDNAAGERFLTDLPALAGKRGLTTRIVTCGEDEALGVNSRHDLARAEAAFQARRRAEMMDNGVGLLAPDTVHFAFDTEIGRDTLVEPFVMFGRHVKVGEQVHIRSFSYLKGCEISLGGVGDDGESDSPRENVGRAEEGRNRDDDPKFPSARVGPFARIRRDTTMSVGSRVGDFVEVKNSKLGKEVSVGHHSYLGDAEVGDRTQIGAGTVTANFNGAEKNKTKIGADCFIGSNTVIVAPLTVGDRAMTAAGSAITEDVGDESLAFGRARQVDKPGLAKRLMDMVRAAKK